MFGRKSPEQITTRPYKTPLSVRMRDPLFRYEVSKSRFNQKKIPFSYPRLFGEKPGSSSLGAAKPGFPILVKAKRKPDDWAFNREALMRECPPLPLAPVINPNAPDINETYNKNRKNKNKNRNSFTDPERYEYESDASSVEIEYRTYPRHDHTQIFEPEFVELQQENNSLDDKVDEYKAKCDELKKRDQFLVRELNIARGRNKASFDLEEALKKKNDILKEKNEEIESLKSQMKLQSEKAKIALDDYGMETQEMKALATKLQSDLVRSKEACNKLNDQNKDMKSLIALLRGQVVDRNSAVDNSRVNISNMTMKEANVIRQEMQLSQETANLLSEQNETLKSMVANMQSQIDEIKQTGTISPRAPFKDNGDGSRLEEPGCSKDVKNTLAGIKQSDMANMSNNTKQSEQEPGCSKDFKNMTQQDYADLLKELDDQKTKYLILLKKFCDLDVVVDDKKQALKEKKTLVAARKKVAFMKAAKKVRASFHDKMEEKERIIMQLQFECETIPDYIDLYRREREKLKEKERELKEDWAKSN